MIHFVGHIYFRFHVALLMPAVLPFITQVSGFHLNQFCQSLLTDITEAKIFSAVVHVQSTEAFRLTRIEVNHINI